MIAKVYKADNYWCIAVKMPDSGVWLPTSGRYKGEDDAIAAIVQRGWALDPSIIARHERMRELAAQDGRDAGPAQECPHGTRYVLHDDDHYCTLCASFSIANLLREVPVT